MTTHGPDAGLPRFDIPDGELLRARVVTDLAPVLEDALDRRLDGYAVIEARNALLLDEAGTGVLTFESGVPSLAYHPADGIGGPAALAAIGAGPYRLELYQLPAADLAAVPTPEELRVPPAMPADRLAGDPTLADRTRRVADSEPDEDPSAVTAFLEDADRIDAIRRAAREEARRRADDWGFSDAIDG